MKPILTTILLLASFLSFSQPGEGWKVLHNNKLLLQAVEEAPDKNVITISRAALTKTGILQVAFQQASEKGWDRTIVLMSEDDAELTTAKGNTFKLTNHSLRNLVKGKQRVMLYTISLPKDPKQRALVRVRRVHLCTIEIKG